MKPHLPPEIEALFPNVVIDQIYKYVPHLKKKERASPPSVTMSPHAERDLRLIQRCAFKGKSEMYMREFDDFLLDRF
jgi:hypothetical protein